MSKTMHTDKEPTNHPSLDEVDEYNKKKMRDLLIHQENLDFDKKLQAIKNRQDFNNQFLIENRPADLILLEKIFTSLEIDVIIDGSHLENYLADTSDEYIIKETLELLEKIPSLKKNISMAYQEVIIKKQILCGYCDDFINKIIAITIGSEN